MKKTLLYLFTSFISYWSFAQNVAIGTGTPTPDASAVLDLQSTDKGLLVPRVANPASIGSPATGLMVYNTTTNKFNYYNGATWIEIGNGSGTVTSVSGTAPIVSSGGNTPAISIPAATSSSNGYLSFADWNTFNNKYSGSGATNTIAKFTGASAVGNSGITDDGTTVAISEQVDVAGGTGTVYHTAPIEVVTNNNPRISFHRPGFVASQIGMDASAVIRTYDNPGTGYEQFAASNIFANGYLSVNSVADASGNIRFSAANPYITASSYFVAPGGAYFNSGTVYFQTQAQFRGGVHNDGATYLQIDGGTSGDTYFNGNVGIGRTSPTKKLEVISPNGAQGGVNGTQILVSPVGGGNSSSSRSSGIDFWSTFDNLSADQGPRRTATIVARYQGGAWTTEALQFHVGITSGANDAGNLPNERMRLNANANPQVVGSWVALSDVRLKTDVRDLNIGLAEVMKLKPVSYNFHDPGGFEFVPDNLKKEGVADLGFIAQDLYKVVPEVVELPKSENSLYGVKYEKLIPVLTKAIQEQQEIIRALQKENAQLKSFDDAHNGVIKTMKAELDLIKERLSIKSQQ